MKAKAYAMFDERYLVVIMNDESSKGYRVKVAPVSITHDKRIIRKGHSQWVDMRKLQKLTPEVVDIMVASHVES